MKIICGRNMLPFQGDLSDFIIKPQGVALGLIYKRLSAFCGKQERIFPEREIYA